MGKPQAGIVGSGSGGQSPAAIVLFSGYTRHITLLRIAVTAEMVQIAGTATGKLMPVLRNPPAMS